MAREAAVAAGNAATVAAAAEVLKAGGNAVDGAVAAGFAAAVAEPTLTSLGGGGFMLIRNPGSEDTLLDFFVDAPGRGLPTETLAPHFTPITINFSGATQVFYAGYGSCAVPGVLDGYLGAHRRFGRLPLADVVAPARELALSGVALTGSQAEVFGLLYDILRLTPDAEEVFGTAEESGILRNHQYSEFLDRIAADNITGWHDAPGMAELLDQMPTRHGLLTQADLGSYQVIERRPLVVDYRGAVIATNPAPSFGGSIVATALEQLASQERTDNLTRRLVAQLDALSFATRATKEAGPRSSKGTTHISVIDPDGQVVAMTTSNGSCSGVMVPGTGVQLNNVMGEADLHPDGFHATAPGTRIGSMMAPMLVDLPNGSVVSLGSGGSERIRSALLRVIVAVVDGNQSLADAVEAPRIHHDGQTIHLEPHVRAHVAAGLAGVAPTHRWTANNLYFGGVHAVARRADGSVAAAADARRDGASAVVEVP